MKSLLLLALVPATSLALAAAAGCSSSSSTNPVPLSPADSGGVADASGDGSTPPPPPADGGADSAGANTTPITGVPDKTWTWVPFAGAVCRDGSATGIAVNLNPAATKVMIYLEGGGACFNDFTCARNPTTFGSAEFASWSQGQHPGAFDRADAANPVKDWSFVYVPYCTGDVHAGNKPDGKSNDGATQRFVGYANVALYLKRLVPTFPTATQVLLTGVSAGGLGTVANYEQVATAFGSVPVDMLDDSGPMFEEPTLATCQSSDVAAQWGLAKTFLATCGADCADNDGGTTDFLTRYTVHLVKKYPNRKFGFMDSVDDGTMTYFFGFGYANCTGLRQLTQDQFTAGLTDIRTKLSPYTNFGTFYFAGTDHTTLGTTSFDTRKAGASTKLTDWMGQLISGTVTNVGP